MSNVEFLIAHSSGPLSLLEVIDQLQDCSVVFVSGWTSNNVDQANRASRNAFHLFDPIVGSLMRARDDIKSGHMPPNPQFMAALAANSGLMAKPVTVADQNAVLQAGHGQGCLPAHVPPSPASLEQVLNKIKHQNIRQANFRIQAGRHILIICANKQNGQPDCVLEFDVQDFCTSCKAAWACK